MPDRFEVVSLETLIPWPGLSVRIASPADPAVRELAASIVEQGLLQPLLVAEPEDGGRLRIIAGMRRRVAAQLAGLTRVPVLVRSDVSQAEALEIALTENLQREDMSPIEEALGIQRLMDETGMVQRDVAEKLGLAQTSVALRLSLLRLPGCVRTYVHEGTLTMAHGGLLSRLEDEGAAKRLADSAIVCGWTVAKLRKTIKAGDFDGRPYARQNKPRGAAVTGQAKPSRIDPELGVRIVEDEEEGLCVEARIPVPDRPTAAKLARGVSDLMSELVGEVAGV